MPGIVQAEEASEKNSSSEIKAESIKVKEDSNNSSTGSSDKGALRRALEQKTQQNEQSADKKKDRYILLLEDNGFAYYMDTQNAKWKKIPYSENEEILDVWIRLVKTEPDEEYSYPQKYFMEHYYLRPKKQQIQFLSELEVTGRPNNAVKERPYSVRNWENLVSGSLEDEIYHRVLHYMKRDPVKQWFKGKSVRDVLEDTLRISL
ncbi:MAG: hypothetical protein K6F95_10450 [Selenomonas sp.]|nr:hypothetical protein [Selenomonas sp.]